MYSDYVAKVEIKAVSREELHKVIELIRGFIEEGFKNLSTKKVTFETFFEGQN